MDYRFTAILIIMLTLLALFGGPAHSKNEYLNNGTNTCSTGDVSVSIDQRDSDSNYRHYSPSSNYDNYGEDRSIRFTWRKYLGSACTDEFKAVQQENMELKQQLELSKRLRSSSASVLVPLLRCLMVYYSSFGPINLSPISLISGFSFL